MFEYHVILSSSKPDVVRLTESLEFECPVISSSKPFGMLPSLCEGFEHHVILSSSKPIITSNELFCAFEHHVILSSSKPRMIVDVSIIVFEYHAILSSPKTHFPNQATNNSV